MCSDIEMQLAIYVNYWLAFPMILSYNPKFGQALKK